MLPVLVMSMVAHEYAHGYAALRQGDPTAKMLGRLTFNPIKHIDPWMTVLLPAMLWFGSGGRMLFGGAKPVPVAPRNFRNYRRGDIIVSLAGIATNLVLFVALTALVAVLGIVGRGMPGGAGLLADLQRILLWGVWFNLLLANFNLIPLPPLDGSRVFFHLLPPAAAAMYQRVGRHGILILVGMIFLAPGLLYTLLAPAIFTLGATLDLIRPFILVPFGVL